MLVLEHDAENHGFPYSRAQNKRLFFPHFSRPTPVPKHTEFLSVLPITMLHHADDIVQNCAALCNLKPPLLCTSKDKTKNKKS